jgi:FMN phosphatase YigB (HAD superfamily)
MKKYIIFDLDGTLIKSEWANFPVQYNVLKKYIQDLEYDYFVYYCTQTAGTPLFDQLRVLLKNNYDEEQLHVITDEIYEAITKNIANNPFFDGVIDMIKEFDKNYSLFLSTGNSDEFALKKLNEWGVHVCFDRIMGSAVIPKGPEHIKIFKEITADEDFEKNCVYIWDGNTDREIAHMHHIDFIKVWKAWIDKYEVEKTVDAKEIIKSL